MQDTKTEFKNGVNPGVVAIAGAAVVGAGMLVAGAIAMKDEKNREKVKEVMGNAKDRATEYVEEVQKQMHDKKEEVEHKLASAAK